MVSESDHSILLGDESEPSGETALAPKTHRKRAVIAFVTGSVSLLVAWRISRVAGASLVNGFTSEGVMSASDSHWYQDPSAGALKASLQVCQTIGGPKDGTWSPDAKAFWPDKFVDVNWEGHCSDSADKIACDEHIVTKFVGDYFDKWLFDVGATNNAVTNKDASIPNNPRELNRWKERVIKRITGEYAKKEASTLRKNKEAPTNWAPFAGPDQPADDKWEVGLICHIIDEERPFVNPQQVPDCSPGAQVHPGRPNFEPWKIWSPIFKFDAPQHSQLCTGPNCDAPAAGQASHPSEHDFQNTTLSGCKHLLTPQVNGEDWIHASLATLDVRACLKSNGGDQQPFSRSWVKACIPQSKLGWPGFVFQFIEEYGIVSNDCVPDYDGFLDGASSCPSTCENGDSFGGHLKQGKVDWNVIFNYNGATSKYEELKEVHHQTAKDLIFNEGPIVGLVRRDVVLAACAQEDVVVYPTKGCHAGPYDPFANPPTLHDGKAPAIDDQLNDMHSVVVHGWGISMESTEFYRIMSAFSDDTKINQCALKGFVAPQEWTPPAVGSAWYSKSLGAMVADSVCKKNIDFCKQKNAGYTDSEDCDGDGVLDHWCYVVGDEETPTYEVFISSRYGCTLNETSCRRSVLPGTTFGCQRPVGWCMFGEKYRRDIDCDGDGNFDHVCEGLTHSGFISSSTKCTDTWGEGATGRKCDPQSDLKDEDGAFVGPKLVIDSGSCAQQGPQCVKSHAAWPKDEYPQGECKFHVEWANEQKPVKESGDCEKTQQTLNESLWLEVLHWDIEESVFSPTGGFLYGDRMMIGSAVLKPALDLGAGSENILREESFGPVIDKTQIDWRTDATQQKEGWLLCLRLKHTIPDVYHATCSELGDDIWSGLQVTDDIASEVVVECNMNKCRKSEVKSATTTSKFVRTTNVCDAGYQVTRTNKFTISFNKRSDINGIEATFDVGFV